uniref:Uncharacterized protein n=1 Tax=Leptobrachium leishanense TaxID=445787 RepID=A0A8C5QFH2_9ANUR
MAAAHPPRPRASASPAEDSSGIDVVTAKLAPMLAALSDALSNRLDSVAADIKKDIKEIGDRTDRLEAKMAEFAGAHNVLTEQVEDLQSQLLGALTKIADLEDRSRRHNLKVRGIPDSISAHDLPDYVTELFQHLLPEATSDSLLFDRIHRLPKPPSAPAKAPKDVLLRLHYYKPREDILRALRHPGALSPTYDHIAIFPDLSRTTLQHRRNFKQVTTMLRDRSIAYRWGFPTKLLISRNGVFHSVTSVSEGMQLLKDWGMEPVTPPSQRQDPPSRLDPEWRKKKK